MIEASTSPKKKLQIITGRFSSSHSSPDARVKNSNGDACQDCEKKWRVDGG